MDQPDANLIRAIETAIESEENAVRFYRESAGKASNPRGRDLLEQLAELERKHLERLTELRDSLGAGGGFPEYGGAGFSVRPPSRIDARDPEANLDDVLAILRVAIDLESRACRRYVEIAEQIDDPRGRELFGKFAVEEMTHRRILSDEYYHLTNKDGVWAWGE